MTIDPNQPLQFLGLLSLTAAAAGALGVVVATLRISLIVHAVADTAEIHSEDGETGASVGLSLRRMRESRSVLAKFTAVAALIGLLSLFVLPMMLGFTLGQEEAMAAIESMLSHQQWISAFTAYAFVAAVLAPCTFWAFMITAGKVPASVKAVREEECRRRKARSENIDQWIRAAQYPGLVLTLVSAGLAMATLQMALRVAG